MFCMNNMKFNIIQILLQQIYSYKFVPVPPPLRRQNANNRYIIQKVPPQIRRQYGFHRY